MRFFFFVPDGIINQIIDSLNPMLGTKNRRMKSQLVKRYSCIAYPQQVFLFGTISFENYE